MKSSALRLVGGKEKLFSEQVILPFHEGTTVTVRLSYKRSISENVTQNRTAKSQMLLTAQIKPRSLDSPSPECSRFRFVRADALWPKSFPCCVQNSDEVCIHTTYDSKKRQHLLTLCDLTDGVNLQQISDYNYNSKLALDFCAYKREGMFRFLHNLHLHNILLCRAVLLYTLTLQHSVIYTTYIILCM